MLGDFTVEQLKRRSVVLPKNVYKAESKDAYMSTKRFMVITNLLRRPISVLAVTWQ